MLRPIEPKQNELEMVTLEQLVPDDHLDPVKLFNMLFIGYLFGIRSRRLVKEIEVNVAYRWFLDLRLTDRVPDASTFSQNRRRRYAGTGIEQAIFDGIVEQALKQGLIGGEVLYTDSTTSRPTPTRTGLNHIRWNRSPRFIWPNWKWLSMLIGRNMVKRRSRRARHPPRLARSKSAVPIPTRAS